MPKVITSSPELRNDILEKLNTYNWIDYDHPDLGQISLDVGSITAQDNSDVLLEKALDAYELKYHAEINTLAKVLMLMPVILGVIVTAIFLVFMRS